MWTFLCVFIVYGTLSVNSEDRMESLYKSQRQFLSYFPSNFNPFLFNMNNFGDFVFPGPVNNNFPPSYNPPIQQTTSAYQTNYPINYNQPIYNVYRPNNQPIQQITSADQINRPVMQTQFLTSDRLSDGISDRISDRKCKEYADIGKKVVFVGSLTTFSSSQGIQTGQCENTQGFIIGGENAKAGEFPHMAAIGYEDFKSKVHFSCGGSLISDRYVLTAAHCKKVNGLNASVVRLGDLNLKIKENLLTEKDVPVERFISHEQYDLDSSKHDIALIKLTNTVKFSKYIKPACLMTSDTIQKKKAIATGWGLTEALSIKTSDIMQKVELNIMDSNQCNQIFDDPTRYSLDNTQLCAGELNGGKDTCQGDSGGPLQVINGKNKCIYTIIGITSYGNIYCGSANSPGVYTRVSSYLDWIERHVWGS